MLPGFTHIGEEADTLEEATWPEGGSADKVRRKRPELFTEPQIREGAMAFPVEAAYADVFQPMAGDDVHVTETDLEAYIEVAKESWSDVAEHLRAADQAAAAGGSG